MAQKSHGKQAKGSEDRSPWPLTYYYYYCYNWPITHITALSDQWLLSWSSNEVTSSMKEVLAILSPISVPSLNSGLRNNGGPHSEELVDHDSRPFFPVSFTLKLTVWGWRYSTIGRALAFYMTSTSSISGAPQSSWAQPVICPEYYWVWPKKQMNKICKFIQSFP